MLGSEGLYANVEAFVDDFTIKVNGDNKFEGQYRASDSEGLQLNGVTFKVKVDNDKVLFTPTGELTADFLRYVGEHGIEIDSEGHVKAILDEETLKVDSEGNIAVQIGDALDKDSEGRVMVVVDGESIIIDANALRLQTKDDALVIEADGVRIKRDESIGEKADGTLFVNLVGSEGIEILHVDNIPVIKVDTDNTLVFTDDGKLHVVARPIIPGDAIKVTSEGDQDKVSVVFDGESIQLGSEGLFVKLGDKKGLELDGADGLGVAVDNVTVKLDSEGKLYSVSTPLNAIHPIKTVTNPDQSVDISLLFDGQTIKLGTSEGLYIPIDKDTIILDGGKIKAKKQLNADGVTIIEDSETLYANIDEKTIIKTNGVLETAVGGWIENPQLIHFINNSASGISYTHLGGGVYRFEGTIGSGLAPVPTDGQIVDITVTNKVGTTPIAVSINNPYKFVDYGTYLAVGDGSPTDELVNLSFEKSTGKFTIDIRPTDATPYTVINGIDLDISGITGIYHTVGANFIPVDGTSVIIKNGVLSTSAPAITPGAGLEYNITPTENILNVLTDSESVAIRSDRLYVPVLVDHTSSEEDLVLTINSEGKPQWLKRAGVTDIIIDGKSIVDEYVATIPVATDSERGVVKFDNDTIVINSEGQIKVVNLVEDITLKHLLLDNVSSEGVRTKHTSEGTIVDPADRVAKLDLTEYSKLNETGYKIELLVDDNPHYVGSEGPDSEGRYILTAKLYDQAGNVLTTSNEIDLPLESMVIDGHIESEPLSDGSSLSFLVLVLKNGKKIRMPMSSVIGGFITIFGDYTGSSSIYGTKNFNGELMNYGHEVITQVQVDPNGSIIWNSSEVCLEVPPYKEGDAVEILDGFNRYKINVKYDDETIKLDSTDNELFVPIDKKTIIIDSSGEVAANIDNATIIYNDFEDQIELPIDNVTVYLSSEGLLKSAGLDVTAGDAIRLDTSEVNGLPVKDINVLYDDKTIVLDSEGKLHVIIDEDSIVINSEGKLEVEQYTVAQVRALWDSIVL